MKIGIVGAGNIGSALTRRLAALGHDVSVANSRGPDTLQELATRSGAAAVPVQEAARGRDLVIVTIPEAKIPDLAPDLFEAEHAPASPVVIDTGNYYPRQRDGAIPAIEDGAVESVWVQEQLGRPVIKAFNNIFADHLLNEGHPRGTPTRIALPVAGDDDRAKRIVMRLVDDLGFDPVDAGAIAESWRQQPGTPVYTTDRDSHGVREALAQASPERPTEWRATAFSPGTYDDPR